MKNTSLNLAGALLLLFISCKKTEVQNSDNKTQQEISLEQKAQVLQNENGESVSVVYFAKGDEVAVKISLNNEEHELSAKGVNAKGEPIFTNGIFAWEIMEDGHSGRLTDKKGNAAIYK